MSFSIPSVPPKALLSVVDVTWKPRETATNVV